MIVVNVVGIVIFVLIAIVLIRTLSLKPTAAQTAVIELDKSERATLYGEKLSKMLQVETIHTQA